LIEVSREAIIEHLTSGMVPQSERRVQAEPSASILWKREGLTLTISRAEELALQVQQVAQDCFGTATLASRPGAFGQVMNVSTRDTAERFIVEVHDGMRSDFAQRVFRGDDLADYPVSRTAGHELHEFEKFGFAEAADLLWAWLHTGLPRGYRRSINYLDLQSQRRFGLA